MSRDPSNSDWLERNLESARRRVNQLEIDAYRIRTDLARLEAANAAGIVNGDVASIVRGEEPDQSAADIDALAARPVLPDMGQLSAVVGSDHRIDLASAAESNPEGMDILIGASPRSEGLSPIEDLEQALAEPAAADISWTSTLIDRSRGMYRRATSPVMASLVVHGAILVLAVSITVASIERNDLGSATTTLVLGDKSVKESESFDPSQLADLGETGVQKVSADLPQFDTVGPVEHEPIPIDFDSAMSPEAMGKMGLQSSVDTNTGVAAGPGGMGTEGQGAGTGSGSGKQRGGPTARNASRLDSTLFFGTEARGNRFVFVVDNSSSMKGGRLEMAVAELVKTVEGLSPRQSFYVIFVSDQTYPMFYPQREPSLVPATPANKKRLAEWAPKAILASRKNRELIKAMDMAASLQPQAVYLLSAGRLDASD